ncbi:unnamed protein product [Psylliodes chrysocephalus]|uniref:Uncharacterized protein n=1 Tax=Psylliodes chrysocephalus TaxID=3402493 RepID=A0A9P0GBK1_9CUCU|nr:unnamed protein product [Psylliodes chrysocephala]
MFFEYIYKLLAKLYFYLSNLSQLFVIPFKMIPLQLEAYIWFFIINLRNEPPLVIQNMHFDVPTILKDPTIEGIIDINNILITGLETIDISDDMTNHVKVTQEDPNLQIFKVCITNLGIREMHINLQYFADIGVNNTVPIYGQGDVGLSVRDLKIEFCTMTNMDEGTIYDMDLFNMKYRHDGPIILTGFYKHPEANDVISRMLNLGHILLTMWNSYEPLKASCILTPVFEFILNAWIYNPNLVFTYNSTCLEGSTFNFLKELIEGLIQEISSLKPHLVSTTNYSEDFSNHTDVFDFLNYISTYKK